MIIELLLTPIWGIIKLILNFLPDGFNLPNYASSVINMISVAGQFIPLDIFLVVISNVTFWLGVHFIWIIIEWAYKKIPGIN